MIEDATASESRSRVRSDMPARDFRRYGRSVLEWAADYLANPRTHAVRSRVAPGDLRRRLPAIGPSEGESMEDILRDFETHVLPGLTHWNHPRFHAYFSISSSAPGILGELLTAVLDVNAMLWQSCPAATELEQVTLAWMLDWLGLPASWFGMIVDSASTGVLQAVVAARDRAEPKSRAEGPSGRLVAYVSDETHSSVEKALIVAGIGRANVRHIPVDHRFRMRVDALRAAMHADVARGHTPFFVAATVGTTSSTAVDPVSDIADLCRDLGLWLHVDGAYGASFGLVPECRSFLDGVERADSFLVSPHKLLMVPLDCSLFYTRHPEVLRRAFSLEADYLKTGVANVVDFMDYGLALGRRFRALKLWFVMRYFGREGLAGLLRQSLELAAWLAGRIAADARFEIAAPVTMGLVCFRLRQGDVATRRLIDGLNESGQFCVSSTLLGGQVTLRVAVGNLRTERRDLEALWTEILKRTDELEADGTQATAAD